MWFRREEFYLKVRYSTRMNDLCMSRNLFDASTMKLTILIVFVPAPYSIALHACSPLIKFSSVFFMLVYFSSLSLHVPSELDGLSVVIGQKVTLQDWVMQTFILAKASIDSFQWLLSISLASFYRYRPLGLQNFAIPGKGTQSLSCTPSGK